MVAAGINYVTDLAIAGHRPMVINMSLGGGALDPIEQAAIDRAIDNGVIVVAAAGNGGTAGMSFPGAYAPVISVAAAGWNNSWVDPAEQIIYRMFWLHNDNAFVPPMFADSGDVPEPTPVNGGNQVLDDGTYIVNFSARELAGQELDVAAPGVWVRGPFAGFPGYNHLPWWSKGIGDLVGNNAGNFFYVSGTSMATPHVAATAAMMLEVDPSLTQAEIENILKTTAIPIPPGTAGDVQAGFLSQSWGSDATGSGLVQVDEAIDAIP
jgi:subtilisin family serine protease